MLNKRVLVSFLASEFGSGGSRMKKIQRSALGEFCFKQTVVYRYQMELVLLGQLEWYRGNLVSSDGILSMPSLEIFLFNNQGSTLGGIKMNNKDLVAKLSMTLSKMI